MCIFDENQGIMLHISPLNLCCGGLIVASNHLTLEYLHRQIMQSFYSRNKNQSLTTASGNQLFGSVAEHHFSDQWVLVSNRETDQRLCFHYIDRKIPLQEVFHVYLNKFEIVVTHLFFVILFKS